MATIFNVSLRTLRFYESIGLLQPRRESGERVYSMREQICLQTIIHGKKLGFSLQEIKCLIDQNNASETRQQPRLTAMLGPHDLQKQLDQLEARRAATALAIDELYAALERAGVTTIPPTATETAPVQKKPGKLRGS